MELLKGEASDNESPNVSKESSSATRKIIDQELNITASCGDGNNALGSATKQPQHHDTDYKDSCSLYSSSSMATSIEDDRGEECQKAAAIDDCHDSVWSCDLSAAAAAVLEQSDDSGRGRNERGDPLLSDREILLSLGYDFDAIQAADTTNSDKPMFIAEEPSAARGNDDRLNDSFSQIPIWHNDSIGSRPLAAVGTGAIAAGMTNNGCIGEADGHEKNPDDDADNKNNKWDYESHGWNQDIT